MLPGFSRPLLNQVGPQLQGSFPVSLFFRNTVLSPLSRFTRRDHHTCYTSTERRCFNDSTSPTSYLEHTALLWQADGLREHPLSWQSNSRGAGGRSAGLFVHVATGPAFSLLVEDGEPVLRRAGCKKHTVSVHKRSYNLSLLAFIN